jgi:hypothetical protein
LRKHPPSGQEIYSDGAESISMKKKVSSSELAWIFVERLSEFRDCPPGVAVAIVPDQDSGWVAVTEKPNGRTKSIPLERFEEVVRSLRRAYQLQDD